MSLHDEQPFIKLLYLSRDIQALNKVYDEWNDKLLFIIAKRGVEEASKSNNHFLTEYLTIRSLLDPSDRHHEIMTFLSSDYIQPCAWNAAIFSEDSYEFR